MDLTTCNICAFLVQDTSGPANTNFTINVDIPHALMYVLCIILQHYESMAELCLHQLQHYNLSNTL